MNCIKQIGTREKLLNLAASLRFYDGRPTKDGATPVWYLSPGYDPRYRLMDLNYGDNAYVVPYVNKRLSNNVVLRENFFGKNRTEQDAILVHELLHPFFQMYDNDLANKFGVFRQGQSSSARLTLWIMADCNNKAESLRK